MNGRTETGLIDRYQRGYQALFTIRLGAGGSGIREKCEEVTSGFVFR